MTEDDASLRPLEETLPAELFKAEVHAWARRIGVEVKGITLRPMRRKWGSCSTRGHLTFDTGLLSQPAAVRRAVIVEELLHLKLPNHGPLFKALKAAYLAGADSSSRQVTPDASRHR